MALAEIDSVRRQVVLQMSEISSYIFCFLLVMSIVSFPVFRGDIRVGHLQLILSFRSHST
jgi:hypothetical protein